MAAWFGSEKLHSHVMKQLSHHRKLDQIIQGLYFEDGKGCHLGCLTHANDGTHEAAERMFNLPLRVGYWLEAVFEGLPKSECEQWVLESTEAIRPGADLSLAHHELSYWLLCDSGLLTINDINGSAIETVRNLCDRARNCDQVSDEEWSAAESAARSAMSAAWSAESAAMSAAWSAESAAWSAAWSAARSAAKSASWSAESAAMSAAWSAKSAAWSASWSAESAARSAAWNSIAEKSIEIFRAVPIVECEQCDDQIEATIIYLNSTAMFEGV